MSGSRRPGYALMIAAIVVAAVVFGFAFRSSGDGASSGQSPQDGAVPDLSAPSPSAEPAAEPSLSPTPPADPDPDVLTVAFIGDQGLGPDSKAVLELIRDEGAEMVLHQGDFDYRDDALAWDQQINDTLGTEFPYFASIGNHDLVAWPRYQIRLQERLDRIDDATCKGNLGIKSSCEFRGLFFVLSGVGTKGSDHVRFLRNALRADRSVWRVCSWHKNQEVTQVGGKGNSVDFPAYETCRKHGAIIATAHEHSYERTVTLSDVDDTLEIDRSCADDPATPDLDVCVGSGSTFVFVSGLGGKSIRPQQRCLPAKYPYGCDGEWAKIYAENHGAQFGALFIAFDMREGATAATGYFKTIDGEIVDSFTITRG